MAKRLIVPAPRQSWYWLKAPGIAWVRAHVPDARIEWHRRLMFNRNTGLSDQEAVLLPTESLAKARRAGFSPQPVNVEMVCGQCKRNYVPGYEDDPCIAQLPGVRFACCGHGKGKGYVFFENGIAIRFSGPDAIERFLAYGRPRQPTDRLFWRGRKRSGH